MNPIVFPVAETNLNLPGLIRACREMKLPNPAEESDKRGEEGIKQAISVLDSIQIKPHMTTAVLQLGYLIIARECDMVEIVANTRGMAHAYHDGASQASQGEVLCCIAVGSIDKWLCACRKTCIPEAYPAVRFVFNRIYRDITTRLPHHVWSGIDTRDNGDGTFLLEHK